MLNNYGFLISSSIFFSLILTRSFVHGKRVNTDAIRTIQINWRQNDAQKHANANNNEEKNIYRIYELFDSVSNCLNVLFIVWTVCVFHSSASKSGKFTSNFLGFLESTQKKRRKHTSKKKKLKTKQKLWWQNEKCSKTHFFPAVKEIEEHGWLFLLFLLPNSRSVIFLFIFVYSAFSP